jgi:hypothetical protein
MRSFGQVAEAFDDAPPPTADDVPVGADGHSPGPTGEGAGLALVEHYGAEHYGAVAATPRTGGTVIDIDAQRARAGQVSPL